MMKNVPFSTTDARYDVTCDVFGVACLVLSAKVVGATSSEGFLIDNKKLVVMLFVFKKSGQHKQAKEAASRMRSAARACS